MNCGRQLDSMSEVITIQMMRKTPERHKRKRNFDEKYSKKAEVWATSFSNNGKTLLTGSRDKTVRLWNLKDFDENDQISMDFVYRGHSFGITGIDHAAFDLYFATSSMDTSGMFSQF